jgi:hypothetical protein
MLLDKIINKIADKYYTEHKEQLENKFDDYFKRYAKKAIEYNTNFLPQRFTDNYYQSLLECVVIEIVEKQIDKRSEDIKEGLSSFLICNQAEKVLKERINEIVEHEYREKISEVVNQIIDNLK